MFGVKMVLEIDEMTRRAEWRQDLIQWNTSISGEEEGRGGRADKEG